MRRAFTLIELLVVIAIIGLLIALALPSLAAARNEAKAAICASRIRQIDQTSQMYAAESKDFLPFANSETAEDAGTWTAPGWLYLYQGNRAALGPADVENGICWRYLGMHDPYRCPMDPPPYNQGPLATMSSYVWNVAISGSSLVLPSYRIGQYRPDAVVIWENDELGPANNFNDGNNEPTQAITARHSGAGNMASIDGSVKRISVADFFTLEGSTPGPLWCCPGQADGKYPPYP